MKLLTKFTSLLLMIFMTISISSCNDDNKNGLTIPSNAVLDFATFVSSNDNGSVFTLQKDGDSPLITLTSTIAISTTDLKPGTRVLIQYAPAGSQEVYQSGAINLYGIARITNGNVEPKPLSEIESWQSDGLKINIMTRTGQYVNVWAEAPIQREPKRFVLVADKTTVDSELVELYLVYQADNDMAAYGQVYASFDLSNVWNKPTCKAVKINYMSRSGMEAKRFDKDYKLPINPDTDL